MMLKKVMTALISLWASSSTAAEIRVMFAEDNYSQIVIQGPITAGDGKTFYDIAERYPRASVALDSPGGDVVEALSIGAEIRLRGYSTYAGGGQDACFSACALIWIAGERRYMQADAMIGVHAAYEMVANEDGTSEARTSGIGNAQIGAYLNELGLSAKAIRFFTVAGPDEVEYITPAVAQVLDIDVFVQGAKGLETPAERPSPRQIANTVSRLLSFSIWCAPILGIPAKPIKTQGSNKLREGHAILGGEIFAPLIVEYSDRRKAEMQRVGKPAWCIATADVLQQFGIRPQGLDGPSFDCIRAKTASERLICNSPELWARDRMLSTAYEYLRRTMSPKDFARVRSNQRNWLQRREECGASAECAMRTYSARLTEMGLM